MTPSLCSVPCSSTYPRGSTKGYSVRIPAGWPSASMPIAAWAARVRSPISPGIAASARLEFDVVADYLHGLHDDRAVARLEAADLELCQPGLLKNVLLEVCPLGILQCQGGRFARGRQALQHLLMPHPHLSVVVHAALERNSRRLGLAELLGVTDIPLRVDRDVLGR